MFKPAVLYSFLFICVSLFVPIFSEDSAKKQTSLCFSLDWAPNGSFLATGSDVGKINIWEVDGQGVVAKKPVCSGAHGRIVESLKWSRSGTFLASGADSSGSRDGELTIWHFDACKKRLQKVDSLPHEFPAKTAKVLAWSADDRYLSVGFLGGQKKLLKVWQIANDGKLSSRCVHEVLHGKSIFSIDWANSSNMMAVGALARKGQLGIWRIDEQKMAKTDEADFAAFEVNQARCSLHNILAVASAGKISFWEIAKKSGRITKYADFDKATAGESFDNASLSWSQDGRLLAVGLASPRGELTIIEFDNVHKKSSVRLQTSINCPVGPISWSPTRDVVAVSGGDGKLRVFALEGKKLRLVSIL